MEVINNFRSLKAHERINLICELFNCCTPIELHFFATYIHGNFVLKEGLVYFQERANSKYFDSGHTSVFDTVHRQELIASTALLSAGNYNVAGNIFTVINQELNDSSNWCRFSKKQGRDAFLLEEVILLVTLISHHPAFKYIQLLTIYDYISMLYLISKNLTSCSETIKVDAKTKPLKSSISGEKKRLNKVSMNGSSSISLSIFSPKSNRQDGVLDIKCRKLPKRRSFELATTWMSLKQTVVRKTFKNVIHFHQRLLHHHSCSSSFDVSAGGILGGSKKDQVEALQQYFTLFLMEMPFYVKDSDLVHNFFKPVTNNRKPPSLVGTSNLSLCDPEKIVSFISLPSMNSQKNHSASDLSSRNKSPDHPVIISNEPQLLTNGVYPTLVSDQCNGKYVKSPVIDYARGNSEMKGCYNQNKLKVVQYSKLPEVKVIIKNQDDKSAFVARDEDRSAFLTKDEDRSAFLAKDEDRSAFPAKDEDRSAFPAKDEDRSAFPAKDEDRSAFPAKDEDRSAFPAKDEDRSAFLVKDEDRSVFLAKDETDEHDIEPVSAHQLQQSLRSNAQSARWVGSNKNEWIPVIRNKSKLRYEAKEFDGSLIIKNQKRTAASPGLESKVIETCKPVTYSQVACNCQNKNGFHGQGMQNGFDIQAPKHLSYGQAVQNGILGQAAKNCLDGQSSDNSPYSQALKRSPCEQTARNSPNDCVGRNSPHRQVARNSPNGHAVRNSPNGHAVRNSPNGHAVRNSPNGHAGRNSPCKQTVANSPNVLPLKNSFCKQSAMRPFKNGDLKEDITVAKNHKVCPSLCEFAPFHARPAFSSKVNDFVKP